MYIFILLDFPRNTVNQNEASNLLISISICSSGMSHCLVAVVIDCVNIYVVPLHHVHRFVYVIPRENKG